MLGSDPAICAHRIQADWIAPPACSLLAVAGRMGAYAGFRHAVTGQLVTAAIFEAYELMTVPAVLIKQAMFSDGQVFEALACYDQSHTGIANCRVVFRSALSLMLPEAS